MKLLAQFLVVASLFVYSSTFPQFLLEAGNASLAPPGTGTGPHQPHLRAIDFTSKDTSNGISIPASESASESTSASLASNLSQSILLPLSQDDHVVDIGELTDDLEDWEAPEFFTRNYPYYLSGYDDEDRPIWVAEMGKFDARPLFEDGGKGVKILEQYAKQGIYRVIKSIREQNVTEAFYLVDMEGFSFFHLTHTPSILLASKMSRKYNDILESRFGGAIIINVNYLANILINTMRPVIGSVMEKIETYGTQQSKWMPALRHIFPPESIPTWYGGSPTFKPIKVYGK